MKYTYVWVGREAADYLMSFLTGKKKIDEDDGIIEADSMASAVKQLYEKEADGDSSEFELDPHYETELCQTFWTGGHEGWLIVRCDLHGSLSKFNGKSKKGGT